jgi:hypothetical protein
VKIPLPMICLIVSYISNLETEYLGELSCK